MRLRRSGRRPSRLALLAPQGDGRHRSLSRRVRARALPTTTENSHPLAKNRGKRSAERPSNHCPRIADKSTQSAQTNLRAEARQNQGALAFRRSTAALASAVATAPLAQLQNHVSWDAAGAGVLPASGLSSPASSTQTGPFAGQVVPRSRPGADCKSARGHRPCSAFRVCLAKATRE